MRTSGLCQWVSSYGADRQWRLVITACALVGILVGCGASPSDPTPALNSRSATTRGPASGAPATGQAPAMVLNTEESRSRQSSRPPTSQQAMMVGKKTDERNGLADLNIPEAVAKGLDSPDARDRYRALDYWDTNDKKAPLTPVFDAMEDDDLAVRAKATAIVEEYWAAEQER